MKMLRTALVILIALQTIFIGHSFAQNANEWLFTGQFNLSYSEKVKVQVGGVTVDKTKKEMHTGSKAGNVTIDPETFKKMEASTGTHFKIEIKKTGTGDLHDIYLTNMDQDQKIKGLYNIKSHKFLFGSAKAEGTANGKCGTIGMGIIKGNLTSDNKAIENGEFGMGFIAGCDPVLINANATFYFTGIFAKEKISPNPNVQSLWSSTVDTNKIKNMLTNGRWEPVFWSLNGTVMKSKLTDFAHFKTSGLFQSVSLNLPASGTWKYDGSNQTITLISLATGTTIYFIAELSDSVLKCSSFNSEFKLRRTATPKNPEIISVKTVMLCKKWNVASYRNGLMNLHPKPGDYVQYHSDGTYEQISLGVYARGTWNWEPEETKITVNCNGVNTWDVIALTNSSAKFKKGSNEELTLK